VADVDVSFTGRLAIGFACYRFGSSMDSAHGSLPCRGWIDHRRIERGREGARHLDRFLHSSRPSGSRLHPRQPRPRFRGAPAYAIKAGAKIDTVFTTGNTLTVGFIVQGIKKMCSAGGTEPPWIDAAHLRSTETRSDPYRAVHIEFMVGGANELAFVDVQVLTHTARVNGRRYAEA
jgi:hypothetical protein